MKKVKIKSRTGHGYLRGPRVWPADRWARVEVDEPTYALVQADPHLDVVMLAEDADVDQPERSPLDQAQHDVLQLRYENARLNELAAELGRTLASVSDENMRLKAEIAALKAQKRK